MKEEKTDRAGEENEDPDTDGAPSDPVPEEESAENETDEEAGEEKVRTTAAALSERAVKMISIVEADPDTPYCGQLPEDPECYSFTDGVEIAEVHWGSSYTADSYVLQTERFEGDKIYTPWFRLKTEEGYAFAEDVMVLTYTGEEDAYMAKVKPLYVDAGTLVFAGRAICEHEWDYDNEIRVDPTCIQDGEITRYCL